MEAPQKIGPPEFSQIQRPHQLTTGLIPHLDTPTFSWMALHALHPLTLKFDVQSVKSAFF
jgi:hypothetical protein